MKNILIKAAGVLAFSLGLSSQALASYPDRPINLIIGFSAGGPTDVVARYVAQGLTAELGQQVIAVNRPGASSQLALNLVKRAEPDGYTLFFASNGALSIQPAYKKSVDYDVLKDFVPVGLTARYPYMLVVPTGSPYKSVSELVEDSKKKPSGLTYASAGNGSLNHLATEWLRSGTGANLTHVPYKGDSDALHDVIAGRVDMAFFSAVAAQPQIEAGKLRALAIAAETQLSVAPGLPTVASETGIEKFTAQPWNGILAPAGLPEEIKNKLNAAINKVLSTDEAKDYLFSLGQYPFIGTPDDFARHISSETENWRKVIDDAGIERVD